jgi:hypothetical protein
MTREQQETAMRWLSERCGRDGRQMTCAACGRTGGRWNLDETMVCLPIWSKGRMDISRVILAVPMTCGDCGHMLLFGADSMGLI